MERFIEARNRDSSVRKVPWFLNYSFRTRTSLRVLKEWAELRRNIWFTAQHTAAATSSSSSSPPVIPRKLDNCTCQNVMLWLYPWCMCAHITIGYFYLTVNFQHLVDFNSSGKRFPTCKHSYWLRAISAIGGRIMAPSLKTECFTTTESGTLSPRRCRSLNSSQTNFILQRSVTQWQSYLPRLQMCESQILCSVVCNFERAMSFISGLWLLSLPFLMSRQRRQMKSRSYQSLIKSGLIFINYANLSRRSRYFNFQHRHS